MTLHPKTFFAIVVALALLIVSCGGGKDFVATTGLAPQSTGTIVISHSALGREINDQVTHFSLTCFDDSGRPVGSADLQEKASKVVIDCPTSTRTLEIEYVPIPKDVRPQTSSIHTFRTAVNVAAGETQVIQDPAHVDTDDETVLAFVTFGCNRVQNSDLSHSDASSANVAQLEQSLAEVSALSPPPSHLFITGDVVANLKDGTAALTSQLTAWKSLFAQHAPGIPTVVMPGNHEMLYKDSNDDELPNPATGDVFTSLLADFIFGDNGPKPVDEPGLARDESKLTYSFRNGTRAFIVLNTESYFGPGSAVGKIPGVWLAKELATLQADPAVTEIFVFGHRPASDDNGIDGSGAFYKSLSTFPKVRGYFCSHAHLWHESIPPVAPAGSTVHQVIAGNGGSRPDSSFKNGYYGYTIVHLKQSGNVTVQSWGRPIPEPYYAGAPQPQSTLREHLTIFTPPG